MRIVQSHSEDPPRESDIAQRVGRAAAKKQMKNPRRHVLDEFWWPGGNSPFAPGDIVLEVLEEGHQRMVFPPGTVVHTRDWASKSRRATFVFIEKPKRNRMRLERLAKRLGRGAKKRLLRAGRVNRNFVDALLAAWQD
jgi:hypothetical protein